MEDKRFLKAKDVSLILGVSVSTAYKIIRRLNDELAEQGFITISGRVSRCYFEQKIFGITRV